MKLVTLSPLQERAVQAPFAAAVAITGAAGTGKTHALRARIARYAGERPDARYLHAAHPSELAQLALELLADAGRPVALFDDVAAEAAFGRIAGPLFALEWDEFEAGTLDPEVGGLRAPERFAASAFRLVRKLRDAAISPDEFLNRALGGATHFYANPPNFAHPDLIYATKDAYRDSLDVDPAELQRQYRREIDLAKILARLFRHWVDASRAAGRMTPRDAIADAIELAREAPAAAAAMRERYPAIFVDEAQEATLGTRLLLEAIYGESLEGVTLAGDTAGATSTFRGARPDAIFKNVERIELVDPFRPQKTERSAQRFPDESHEAAALAEAVAAELRNGVAPSEIGVIFRSVCDVERYERALLDVGIPVAVGGDVNCFADRRALDALALLWNVWDPFRHDWLIRTLRGRAVALSDASIATLCAEPPDNQEALFAFDDERAPTERAGRWDPKRDVRLGWNVVRGTVDTALPEDARERVQRLRSLRSGWIDAMSNEPFAAFVRRVWSEGLASEGAPGSATALAQQALLRRLLARLQEFVRSHPQATLGDVLADADLRAQSDLECCEPADDPRFVQILSVDAARGRSFETVFIPDARAGSFPRWYVPDAFLFSPKYGMIPKDNVGDAKASRTAKFSYYVARMKTREQYNDEERRAFKYAMRRAKRRVVVTASGRATRGTTAPEFLEELRKTL